MVKLEINNKQVNAKKDETIIQVAERNGINIPTFCYHPRLKVVGACRICVVELEGFDKLVASCSTPVKEGMKIYTHSKRVIEARKEIIELLLASHDLNCPTCRKNLNCKLQEYSRDFMIEDIDYEMEPKKREKDTSSVSIVRDPNKCILCERCIRVCNTVQTVHAIENAHRGNEITVTPPFDHKLSESSCINCGQCVVNCPTGALVEKSDITPIVELLRKKLEKQSNKHIVVQTAPSIRATLGELFGMEPGTFVTGKMVSALRKIGFDKVFDTDLCADMTIVEEATEFIKRYKKSKDLPLITTCCPAWIKFGEQFFFEELTHMSTCRSPQAMMGSLVKNFYSKEMGIDPKDIILVDIMPCTAKKFEIARPEFRCEVDYVLTTQELGNLLKIFNINFPELPDSKFDSPLGEASGAGAIFGRTGGVMEAALRTSADMISGKQVKKLDYHHVRGMETLKEAEINLEGNNIKVAVVQTLGEARKIMEQIQAGTCPYHFIEIMACYGGCIGGGGQPPLNNEKEILEKRASALNNYDKSMKLRKSHKNPTLQKIYKKYFGKFGGKNAHKYLHTSYVKRKFIG